MAQLIYSILALLIVMVVSMNTQRSVMGTAEDQAFNEVTTQMTGVGTEVLERIGRTHFDWYNWQYGVGTSTLGTSAAAVEERRTRLCGRLNDVETDSLAAPGAFTACGSYANCPYIEGFHDMADFVLTRGDFEFTVDSIRVEYVDPVNITTTSGTPTFAKHVSVTIEYPGIYFNEDPTNTLKLDLDRVFIYGCVTDASYIPQPPIGERCPGDPAAMPPQPVPLCSVSP
jgi:hypothetical protein